MTPADYKANRKKLGTQREAAAVLGVSRETIAKRETGVYPINKEAALAMAQAVAKRLGRDRVENIIESEPEQ